MNTFPAGSLKKHLPSCELTFPTTSGFNGSGAGAGALTQPERIAHNVSVKLAVFMSAAPLPAIVQIISDMQPRSIGDEHGLPP